MPEESGIYTGARMMPHDKYDIPQVQVTQSLQKKKIGTPVTAGADALQPGHLNGRRELLFFGPDENTAGFMDLGAEHGRVAQQGESSVEIVEHGTGVGIDVLRLPQL